MSKFKALIATSVFVSSFAVAEDPSSFITEYCGAKHYEYSHKITIGEITGVGSHRNGFLQVTETSNDDELKMLLLKRSSLLTDKSDCLTYISSLGIASFGEATDKGYLVARVHFAFDKYNLTPLAKDVLSGVARQLAQNDYQVTVEGHTDWIGSESYNQALGLNRAQSTAKELQGFGIAKQNVTLKSFGESEPIASNNSKDGRSQNRRSDVYIPVEESGNSD
ncbi:OmpA family protein [Vibrio methylphosphonaticus]|uniref:OmpA family protein n=1 Tax=Vibrio methylphosphonaticus TaxID=2946866 RepID=UPI00202A725E|nr:OmpA family protein [Vibrio methylphosphonaticus]MCL9775004.1 OmpA family protein [Vibrio methylphosphonaticus]